MTKKLEQFKKLKHVGDVRQCGFMAAIELVKDKRTKEDYPMSEKIGIKVIQEARKRGLIIRPLGNIIVIMPPLCISEEDLNRMMDIIYDSISKITGHYFNLGD